MGSVAAVEASAEVCFSTSVAPAISVVGELVSLSWSTPSTPTIAFWAETSFVKPSTPAVAPSDEIATVPAVAPVSFALTRSLPSTTVAITPPLVAFTAAATCAIDMPAVSTTFAVTPPAVTWSVSSASILPSPVAAGPTCVEPPKAVSNAAAAPLVLSASDVISWSTPTGLLTRIRPPVSIDTADPGTWPWIQVRRSSSVEVAVTVKGVADAYAAPPWMPLIEICWPTWTPSDPPAASVRVVSVVVLAANVFRPAMAAPKSRTPEVAVWPHTSPVASRFTWIW